MKCMIVLLVAVAVASAQYNPNKRFNARFQPQPYRPVAAASNVNVRRAAPPPPRSGSDQTADIVLYDSEINPDGSYKYAYETANGIAAQEQGTPRDLGGNPKVVAITAQGSYAYTAPDGTPVAVSYIADENGYQPSSDILPVGPPTPPAILRALEYIARNAPRQK